VVINYDDYDERKKQVCSRIMYFLGLHLVTSCPFFGLLSFHLFVDSSLVCVEFIFISNHIRVWLEADRDISSIEFRRVNAGAVDHHGFQSL